MCFYVTGLYNLAAGRRKLIITGSTGVLFGFTIACVLFYATDFHVKTTNFLITRW